MEDGCELQFRVAVVACASPTQDQDTQNSSVNEGGFLRPHPQLSSCWYLMVA